MESHFLWDFLSGPLCPWWLKVFSAIVTHDLDGTALIDNHGAGGCYGDCPDQIDHPAAGQSCSDNWRNDGCTPNSAAVYSKATTPRVCNTNCSRQDFDLPLNLGLPVVYRGVKLDLGYRRDLVVEDLVVVGIKSVDGISPVHQAQILSYLKLSGKCIGLLINFNVVHLRDGIKRFVNGAGWK